MPDNEYALMHMPDGGKIVLEGGKPIIAKHPHGGGPLALPPGYSHNDGYAWQPIEDAGFMLGQTRHHRIPNGHEVDPTKPPQYALEQVHVGRIHRRHHLRLAKKSKAK